MGSKSKKKKIFNAKKEQLEAQVGPRDETQQDTTSKRSEEALMTAKENVEKANRKRKRHYFNAIREQMEFYFGDANLTKDRFLRKLIDKDPYVQLEVFLTFNKIKALTNKVEDIVKALNNSELLVVDEKGKRVQRKKPLPEERNVDDKTLYVEGLPPQADHDWVRRIFQKFGKVTYVSLPKYTQSRRIKEFGFVEFEKEESIGKAIKAFNEFNAVMCMLDQDPAELTSVKAYIKELESETEDTSQKMKKRKDCTSDDPEKAFEPKAKKIKLDNTTEELNVAREDEKLEETNNKKTDEGEHTEKKKCRKKKKKSKSADKMRFMGELSTDVAYYELKILPKKDWKKLRNKYLNLQRESVRELKRKIWHDQQQQIKQDGDLQNDGKLQMGVQPAPQRKMEHKLQKMNMNFYGANEEEAQSADVDNKEATRALAKPPLFSYEPGLIVQITLLEPCVDIKEFKTELRQYPAVKYVDVKEGAQYAHLRLETADAAVQLVQRLHCTEYQCKILAGEAETQYWQKIERDREQKLSKQIKVPQKRGRDKIKKIINKHLYFNDAGCSENEKDLDKNNAMVEE